jgi:hypothetical protein
MINDQTIDDLADAVLLHAQRDLLETIQIQEATVHQGGHCPKLGAYWDELYLVTEELKRRRGGVAA